MPQPKNPSGDSNHEIDSSKLEGDDAKIYNKSSRKADAVKNIFITNYGFTDGDPHLDKMVERELAHGRSISKLLRQKIDWRKKAGEKEGNEDNKENNNSSEVLTRNRKKAAEGFLNKLKEKHPDLGKDIKATYAKIKDSYKEKGDETSVKDFEATMNNAFKTAFPSLHEESIRTDERNKTRETDEDIMDFSDISSSSNKSKEKRKPGERRILKTNNTKAKNWYPKDKS